MSRNDLLEKLWVMAKQERSRQKKRKAVVGGHPVAEVYADRAATLEAAIEYVRTHRRRDRQ
jgi:hypothetical protein